VDDAANGRGETPSGRDAMSGRFVPGNTLSRGHGRSSALAELKREVLDCASRQDRKATIKAAVESAKGGDIDATKLLWSYWYGKPPTAIEISAPGGEPLNLTLVSRALHASAAEELAAELGAERAVLLAAAIVRRFALMAAELPEDYFHRRVVVLPANDTDRESRRAAAEDQGEPPAGGERVGDESHP
jgi:hypothetical protein